MRGDVDPAWIVALVTLATAVTGLLVWLGRTGWHAARRVGRFLDDYFGEPAHDGLAPKPGVMARLSAVETQLRDIGAEVHPNSGHSLRDVVHQTADDVSAVKTGLRVLSERVEQIGGSK